MPDLELTVKQAARELDVTPRTVRNWCKQGRLAGKKVAGKFGPRWLISAQSVREKRAEPGSVFSRGRTQARLSDPALDELRSLREELAAYRGQLERLTAIIERQLPPARPWWAFWRR